MESESGASESQGASGRAMARGNLESTHLFVRDLHGYAFLLRSGHLKGPFAKPLPLAGLLRHEALVTSPVSGNTPPDAFATRRDVWPALRWAAPFRRGEWQRSG